MLPDRVSNPEPLTYEPGALPIALRGPAIVYSNNYCQNIVIMGGLGSQPPGAEITYIFTG